MLETTLETYTKQERWKLLWRLILHRRDTENYSGGLYFKGGMLETTLAAYTTQKGCWKLLGRLILHIRYAVNYPGG